MLFYVFPKSSRVGQAHRKPGLHPSPPTFQTKKELAVFGSWCVLQGGHGICQGSPCSSRSPQCGHPVLWLPITTSCFISFRIPRRGRPRSPVFPKVWKTPLMELQMSFIGKQPDFEEIVIVTYLFFTVLFLARNTEIPVVAMKSFLYSYI